MSLVKLDFGNLNEYLLIMMAPSLPSSSRYLTVSNATSGAHWTGSPEPLSMLLPLFGVKFIDLGDSCFALTSTDEGVTKYLSVVANNGGYISATSSRITENEIFAIYTERDTTEDNSFYLASATGKFVTMVESSDEFGDIVYKAIANAEATDLKTKFSLYAVVRPDDGTITKFS